MPVDLHTDGLKGWERRELERERQYVEQQSVLSQIEAHAGGILSALKAPPAGDVLAQQTAMVGPQGTWTLNWPTEFLAISIGNTSATDLTVVGGAPAGSGEPPTVGAGVFALPSGIMRTVALRGNAVTVYGIPGALFDVTLYSRPREPNAGPCGGALAAYPAQGVPATGVTPENFPNWRRIASNARAGTASGKLFMLGDSLTEGGGITPNVGTQSVPALLAGLLAAGDVPAAQSLSIPGLAGADSRWNTTAGGAPAGWAQTITTVGFADMCWRGSVGADPLTFTPGIQCDTFDVYYTTQGGAGACDVAVDGGAPTNINQNFANSIQKVTVIAAAANNHVLSIGDVTVGNVRIVAVDAYLSTALGIHVGNGGVGGSQTLWWSGNANAAQSISAIEAYAPDVTILGLGVNDSNGAGYPVPQFTSQLETIIAACKVSGDVLLWTPVPSELNQGFSLTAQAEYAQVMFDLGATMGCGVVDIASRFGSWVEANALGFMSDNIIPGHSGFVHPSLLGNWDIAVALKNALALVA